MEVTVASVVIARWSQCSERRHVPVFRTKKLKQRNVAGKIQKGLGLCLVLAIQEQPRSFFWVIAGRHRTIGCLRPL